MNRFLIVIPSYNEEDNIADVLEELLDARLPVDVLVVNDGSRDQTEAIARRYPVIVISHPCNLGYGAALQTGFKFACEQKYPFVIQYDADGQHNPKDLPAIMNELDRGDVDIVIGCRYTGKDGGGVIKLVKKLGVLFFRKLIQGLTGLRVKDPTSGLRGIAKVVFEYYAVRDRFPAEFPDADILIQMILLHYRIREIPVHMRDRKAGVSMHAGIKPLFYMIRMMLSILIVIIRHKRMKRVVQQ